MMIVLIYTGANKVVGDRTPQWAARETNVFILNVLFVIFCVYIKIPKKNDIFWDKILDNNICSHVNYILLVLLLFYYI